MTTVGFWKSWSGRSARRPVSSPAPPRSACWLSTSMPSSPEAHSAPGQSRDALSSRVRRRQGRCSSRSLTWPRPREAVTPRRGPVPRRPTPAPQTHLGAAHGCGEPDARPSCRKRRPRHHHAHQITDLGALPTVWPTCHRTEVIPGPFQGKEVVAGRPTRSDNHSFLVNPTREQVPLWASSAHLGRSFENTKTRTGRRGREGVT